MFASKRHEAIMMILMQEGCVDAAQLSEYFAVTPKTIRKDLQKLGKLGLLERVHGGAIIKQSNINGVFPIEERKRTNLKEKRLIGVVAHGYVEENDTIILDGGTTTLELAKVLGDKKVTVITHDLRIATELMLKETSPCW